MIGKIAGIVTLLAALAMSAQAGFGIRGNFGYGVGLAGRNYGSNVSSGGGYPISPGAGFVYGLEGLYGVNDHLEFGLGVSPIKVDAKDSSTYTNSSSNITFNNESALKFSSLPFVLTTYLKQPLSADFTLLAGIGIGYATGGDYTSTSSQINISAGAPAGGSTNNFTYSLDGTMVYKGVVGAEYALTPSFSIFGDIDAITANYGPSKYVSNVNFYDSAGVVTNSSISTSTYQSTAPARSSNPTVTFVDNRAAGTGTTVSTFDDGVYKNTTTRTYVSSTQTKIESASTFIVYKLGTLDIQPLSLKVGGTFRF